MGRVRGMFKGRFEKPLAALQQLLSRKRLYDTTGRLTAFDRRRFWPRLPVSSVIPIFTLSRTVFCDRQVNRQSLSQATVSARRSVAISPYQISRADCLRTLPIGG